MSTQLEALFRLQIIAIIFEKQVVLPWNIIGFKVELAILLKLSQLESYILQVLAHHLINRKFIDLQSWVIIAYKRLELRLHLQTLFKRLCAPEEVLRQRLALTIPSQHHHSVINPSRISWSKLRLNYCSQ